MILAIAIFLIFLFFALLMYSNKIPALLALPIMAVLIAVFAGMSPQDIVRTVISDGASRLGVAIVTVLFGSMLSQFVAKSGIAETLIKKVAELSGDNPFLVSLFMVIIVAVLFTVLGGLGAVIMVASIVLPILLSIGVPRVMAGCLFLMGMSLGGIFNLTNWQIYISVLQIPQEQILGFSVLIGAAALITMVLFLAIELKRMGTSVGWNEKTDDQPKFVSWYAALTPIVPLFLVLGFSAFNFITKPVQPFEVPIMSAMIAGRVW